MYTFSTYTSGMSARISGGVRVLFSTEAARSSPADAAEKARMDLMQKHKDAFIQHLEAMLDSAKGSTFDTYASQNTAEKDTLNQVKRSLDNIGTPKQKELLEQLKNTSTPASAPTAPTALAPASVVAANPTVAAAQAEASKVAVDTNAKAKVEVNNTSTTARDELSTDWKNYFGNSFKEFTTTNEKATYQLVIGSMRYSNVSFADMKKANDLVVADKNTEALAVLNPYGTVRQMSTSTVSTGTSTSKESTPGYVDPRIDTLVSIENQYVKKGALKLAISRAAAGYGGLDAVYARVVGTNSGTIDPVVFNNKLALDLSLLKEFGAGNGGLDALLSGGDKVQAYMTSIRTTLIANPNIPIPVLSVLQRGSTLGTTIETIIGGAATVLVSIATGGIVTAGHEADTPTASKFMEKYNADVRGGFWNRLGNVATWLKEAFMGRKLSITLGANESEGNVTKYYDAIKKFTVGVMQGNLSASTDPAIKAIYPDALRIAQTVGVDVNSEEFKKALIQTYIANEGFARQGVDWVANIGLFFVGAGRSSINNAQYTTGISQFNEIEKGIMKRKLSPEELRSAGVTIQKVGTDIVHTIPSTIRFAGDISNLPVNAPAGFILEGPNYVMKSPQVMDFGFSHNNITGTEPYTVSTKVRTPQPALSREVETIIDIPASGSLTEVKQSVSAVKSIRSNNETKLDKNLDQVLYDLVGHNTAFKSLAIAVSKGDIPGANAELAKLATKFAKNKEMSTYIKMLQADSANMAVWDTYMSGNKETRKLENPEYNTVRTPAVISAESRLAKKSGFPVPSDEDSFKVSGTYSAKQISEVISSQEVTSVQFMTPLDEKKGNALHRISVNDASFRISETSQPVTDDARKGQVIDGIMKNADASRGIVPQFDKLNKFLADNKLPAIDTVSKYIQYLKDGNISTLGVPGLSVQAGKETKIIEARAMVAGNICLNATYAIGYPAFEIKVDTRIPGRTEVRKQTVDTPLVADATTEYSTPTNINVVQTKQSALGVSPVGIAANALNKPKPVDTPNTPAPGTSNPGVVGGTPVTPGTPPTPVTPITGGR